MQVGNAQNAYTPPEVFAGPPMLAADPDPGRLMATPTVQELAPQVPPDGKLMADKGQDGSGLHVNITI